MDLGVALDPQRAGEVGVPAGAELLAFADAAQTGSVSLAEARAALEQAVGAAGVLEAAATVAVFDGLVRVADATGIQLDAGVLADSADFRSELGVDGFAGSANTTVSPEERSRSSIGDLFA